MSPAMSNAFLALGCFIMTCLNLLAWTLTGAAFALAWCFFAIVCLRANHCSVMKTGHH